MVKKYNSQAMIEKILVAATELFASKGVSQTSMQDITLRAGISKGAIYHHFKSKNEIFEQVLHIYEEQILLHFKEWKKATAHLTGLEQLKELLLRSLTSPEMQQLSQSIDHKSMNAGYKMITMQINLKSGGALIADTIRKGIADGSIKTDYPDECAEAFILLLDVWEHISTGDADVKKRLRFIQELMKSLGIDLLTDEIFQQLLEEMEKERSK